MARSHPRSSIRPWALAALAAVAGMNCFWERDNPGDEKGGNWQPVGLDLGSPSETWKRITGGKFQMGSPSGDPCLSGAETPQHQVILTHAFEMQTTEVTQAQFTAVMGYNPSSFKSCGSGCPVEKVSWDEAASYANALSDRAGKSRCYACSGSSDGGSSCQEASGYSGQKVYDCPGYRLPTEAEWEYAYRAGTSTALYNGPLSSCTGQDANADQIAWYWENADATYSGCYSSGSRCLGPHPVGRKQANAWGLYDMAGNVWEWCHDGWESYTSSGVTDPVGSPGARRVLRGGSWYARPWIVRAAARYATHPGARVDNLGFRLSRSVP